MPPQSLSVTPLHTDKLEYVPLSMKIDSPVTEVNASHASASIYLNSDSLTDEEVRLRALNHSKDKLFSIVGHDLRSAISAVLSGIPLLEKRLDDKNLDEAKRLARSIHKTAQDASDLLGDLAAWTRNSTNELGFNLEKVDLLELLQVEIDRLQEAADQKMQAIKIEPADSGLIRVDPNMFRSIFRNLLTNAIKFSHQGGITRISIFRHSGNWEFQVADEGVGMDAGVQSRLLSLDENKKRLGTSGESGSGFGLLLCDDLIQRHGGELTWTSKKDKGSTFSFTIPDLVG
jgi:signal transduction histidine kinase